MAQKISKILVPLDGSKNADRGLDTAIYLARQCGATITGISVLQHLPVTGLHNVKAWRDKFVKETKKMMVSAKKRSAQHGIDFKEKIAYGYAGDVIANFAQKNRFDLIVMGSRGRSSTKEAFLGSVSNHVLHKAKMPVVIVK